MTATLTLVPTVRRPDLDPVALELFREHWPEYIFHDVRVKPLLEKQARYFGDWDFYALDGDRLVGAAYGVPLAWDGTLADLPTGFTDSLARSVRDHEAGTTPDTLVIMGAMVRTDEAGRGRAGAVLTALREHAIERGLARVVAPVRPTLKHAYPLADIEEFAGWTRADGLPFDPWIRTHVRLGARILCGAPRSQTMTGTVAEWESWTEMAFPATGDYVIPRGLALLHVDREQDSGTYHDPNIWMRHV